LKLLLLCVFFVIFFSFVIFLLDIITFLNKNK
jgi:hypothetical protein